MASTMYTNMRKRIDEEYTREKQQTQYASSQMFEAAHKPTVFKALAELLLALLMWIIPIALFLLLIGALAGDFVEWVMLLLIAGGIYGGLIVVLFVIDKIIGEMRESHVTKNDFQQIRRKLEMLDQKYQQDIANLESWYAQYKAGVKQLAIQYANGSVAPSLAKELLHKNLEDVIIGQQQEVTRNIVDVTCEFTVYKTEIISKYKKINFNQERINDLTTEQECEALANAIARIMRNELLKTYPTAQVTVTHDDAAVTIHYKDVNPKYVPKRSV